LHAIGKPILAGDRIRLRPLAVADAGLMHTSLEDPVLCRLTGTHARFTFEQIRAHCERIEAAGDRWDYGILVEGRLIGEVVLNHLDPANRSCSLRIAIWSAADRGRGYGTEAVGLVVDFAFRRLDLNRVELEVYAFNPQARRAYEKAGFRLEGTKREALIWNGEKVDAHLMSILKNDPHAS
jgi:RimJ/RimL family protein N-acetyltransferase